ncbi:MAG: hypothetical protein AB1458_14225 [Bacteroidota bacterium]
MKNPGRPLIFLCLCIWGIWSCRKEFGRPQWDIDGLAPIVTTSLDFDNILADSLLQENPDNSLTLVYNNNLYSFTADSLFEIPDTSIDTAYVWQFINPLILNPGDILIAGAPQNTVYNINGAQLRKVIIRSGYMKVEVKNEIREVCKVIYQIPLATKNSQPFSKLITIPAATTSGPSFFTDTFNLNGYTIDLTGPSGNGYNTVSYSITAYVDSAGAQTTVNQFDSVGITNSFLDMVPQYALGYFGQGIYASADTSAFTMFNRIVDGTLRVDSVNIKLNVINEAGIDARFNIGSLTSINSRTGSSVPLSHPVIGSTVNITRAFDAAGTVIPTIYSTALYRWNSNIIPMIENLPDKIGYSVNAEVNPLGNISGSNDFIYYGMGLKVNLDMEIPLSFAADRLTLVDTVDLDISAEAENVNSATLHLYANNGFPFETSVQLYLLDGNNAIVDSIMPAVNTIDEAPVDANNIVIQPKMTRLVIPLDANKLAVMKSTRKMMIKIKLNTANYPQYVKIYSSYKIDVQLVGDFNYHISAR